MIIGPWDKVHRVLRKAVHSHILHLLAKYFLFVAQSFCLPIALQSVFPPSPPPPNHGSTHEDTVSTIHFLITLNNQTPLLQYISPIFCWNTGHWWIFCSKEDLVWPHAKMISTVPSLLLHLVGIWISNSRRNLHANCSSLTCPSLLIEARDESRSTTCNLK